MGSIKNYKKNNSPGVTKIKQLRLEDKSGTQRQTSIRPTSPRSSRDCTECEGPDAGLYCCDSCAFNYCTLLSSDEDNYNPTCDYGRCCKCGQEVIILHEWEYCPTHCTNDQPCPSLCCDEQDCPYDTPEECEQWECVDPVPGCTYGGGVSDEMWCNEFYSGDTLPTPGRGYSTSSYCINQPPGSVIISNGGFHSNTYETPYNYNPAANIDDCSCIIGGTLDPYYSVAQCNGDDGTENEQLMEDCRLCGEDRDWFQGCPDPKAINHHPYAATGCIDVACGCSIHDGVPGKSEFRGALDCCQYDQYWQSKWPNTTTGSTNQFFMMTNVDIMTNIQLPDGSYLQDGDEIGFFQDVIEVSYGGQTYYIDNYIMNCSNCNEEVAEEFVCSSSWDIPSPGECMGVPEDIPIPTNEAECLTDESGGPTGYEWRTPTYCIPDFDNISNGAQDHFLIDENGNPIGGNGWYCEIDSVVDEFGIASTQEECEAVCMHPLTGYYSPCYFRVGDTCSFQAESNIESWTTAACLPRCECESASDCIFELETTNELSEGSCKQNSQAVSIYRVKGYEEYGAPEFWSGYRVDVIPVNDGMSYFTMGANNSPTSAKIYRKETDVIYDCVNINGESTFMIQNNIFFSINNISVLSGQECGMGCTDFNSLNCSPWCTQCGCVGDDCHECTDDGSCIEHTYGCMQSDAYNYNPYATAECTNPENQNDCFPCDYECNSCVFFGFGGITENENGNPVVSVVASANSEITLAGGHFSIAGSYNVVNVFGGMINIDDSNVHVETQPVITILCANPNTCGQDFVITTEPQIIFYMELERGIDAISTEDDPITVLTPDTCFHVINLGNATPPYLPLAGLVDIGMNPNYPSCFNYQFLEQGWIPGDVNQDGMINVQDVIMIVQHIMDPTSLNSLQIRIADVNRDGWINVVDALYLVNLIMGNVPYPQQQQVEEELRRAMKPLNVRGTQRQTPIRPGDSVRDIEPG